MMRVRTGRVVILYGFLFCENQTAQQTIPQSTLMRCQPPLHKGANVGTPKISRPPCAREGGTAFAVPGGLFCASLCVLCKTNRKALQPLSLFRRTKNVPGNFMPGTRNFTFFFLRSLFPGLLY